MIIDGTRSNDRAIEVVLAYYNAFNRGDWAGMLVLLAEDVAHDVNQGPREVGKAAFAAFLQRAEISHHEQLREIVVMTAPDGQRAAAEYVAHGEYLADDDDVSTSSGPAHGQKYVLPGGAFFEIRDGRIQRLSNYCHHQQCIARVAEECVAA